MPPRPIEIPQLSAVSSAPRATYRHGDLRRALLEAGIELARAGGPDAVVLREATRRTGVVPNAAYRHFGSRQALLQAVRAGAVAALAVAMEAELHKVPRKLQGPDAARAALRAVGAGYMGFARNETGLFRMAFVAPEQIDITHEEEKAGYSGLDPFQLLCAALDRMVETGVLPSERRPGAEFLAWASVHGMAMLMIDGPLRGIGTAQAKALGQQLLDMVEKGI